MQDETIQMGNAVSPSVYLRRGVCAFDMGYKNYAFFACSRDFSAVLGYGKLDLSEGKKVVSITRKHVDALSQELQKRESLWRRCSHMVIEKQMKVNAKATRMEHHTQSYFWLLHPECDVKSVGASKKTALLSDAAAMPCKTQKDRQKRGRILKSNAVEVAERLLKKEMKLNDKEIENVLRGGVEKSKKDDIADCVIMAFQKTAELRTKSALRAKKASAKPGVGVKKASAKPRGRSQEDVR